MRWYKEIVSRGLKCADAVVAPSQWMLNALASHYELPLQSSVIYNGRSKALFRSSERKSDCVLAVGRVWDEAKQMRLLLARKQPVNVRIAGCAEHPNHGSSWVKDAGMIGNVEFCGEQEESQLQTLYADCATYAATSRYEPFGLAPLEAALSGCALIANDIPVFRELWGNAAFFFKRNDADSLATAIRIFSENASLRKFFAEQAFERASSRFDRQRMVEDYAKLYCELTGDGVAA
jgi:glycosyltransferase involved in cell wall biosynthesis